MLIITKSQYKVVISRCIDIDFFLPFILHTSLKISSEIVLTSDKISSDVVISLVLFGQYNHVHVNDVNVFATFTKVSHENLLAINF